MAYSDLCVLNKKKIDEYILLGFKFLWIAEKLEIPPVELKEYFHQLNKSLLLT